jgi:predicted O-methyltransferase YrrM
LEQFAFSQDWFSPRIPQFKSGLSHLAGKACRILEIGMYEGRSTTWLLANVATHPLARIDAVDFVEQGVLRQNLDATGASQKVSIHIGRSFDILRTLSLNAYDFAYIDGSHATIQVLEDAVLSFRLVKPRGIIAFDDYLWDNPKFSQGGTPKPAIDAFIGLYGKRIEILHKGWQVWVRKLTD